VINRLRDIKQQISAYAEKYLIKKRIKEYIRNGREPWSTGYHEYKWSQIETTIEQNDFKYAIEKGRLNSGFGIGLDERIVEYPWIFSNLNHEVTNILDAGSTFNFKPIVNIVSKYCQHLTIFTYYPENENYLNKRISYVFGDLRKLPFRDCWFEQIVCQSTIEHIAMDNSIYGYKESRQQNSPDKNYEYLQSISELVRVLKIGGQLLLTFPYGKFENHSFFQQFDHEMTEKLIAVLFAEGRVEINFFKYDKTGWNTAMRNECDQAISFNPHTGKGKGDDGAAHCRSICCVKFIKSNDLGRDDHSR
jgi:SAM-dependent methyltransferase